MDHVDMSLEAQQAEKRRKQMVRKGVLERKIERIRREMETIDAQDADLRESAIPRPDETHVVISLAERRRQLADELKDLEQEIEALGK